MRRKATNTKLELSKEDVNFIKENRFKMSMRKMAKEIGYSYFKVRCYMIENNLQLTEKEVNEIKKKTMSKSRGSYFKPDKDSLLGIRESMKEHLKDAIL